MKTIANTLIEFHGAHMASEHALSGIPNVSTLLRQAANEIKILSASRRLLKIEVEQLREEKKSAKKEK